MARMAAERLKVSTIRSLLIEGENLVMSSIRAFILLTVALMAPMPARAEAPFDFETTPGTLPKNVRPITYQIDLDLTADLNTFVSGKDKQGLDFKGRVDVAVEVAS